MEKIMAIPLTTIQQEYLDESNALTFCKLIKIICKDGTVIRMTDHDSELTFNEELYLPLGSANASAVQRPLGLRERNIEFVGVLESDAITHEDLRAGKYRDAIVNIFIVNWKTMTMGAFRNDVFWINDTTFSGDEWQAKLGSLSSFLSKPVGRIYTRTCRHVLGDSGCKVDLEPYTFTGEVIASDPKRSTFTSDLDTQEDHYFSHGYVIWLTGNNAGYKTEIFSYLQDDGHFILKLDTNKDILPGDTFSAIAGCDRAILTCNEKFGNQTNYGGFPFIPGTDKMLESPTPGAPVIES
jgi:uncharacterized phage protein (TIGR02218 family)